MRVDRPHAMQERSIEDVRAATKHCHQCRRTLRAAARAIVRVGRLVNLVVPLIDTLRLPDDELLAYARGLLERVWPHAAAFVAEGLPPDVLKQLADEIAARAVSAAAARHPTADGRNRC
jgi:hypothetical protein